MKSNHTPVLLNEVIGYLDLKPGDKIIDATFGAGGHSSMILKVVRPHGKILGIEETDELYDKARAKFEGIKEIILVNGNFRDLKKIAEKNNFTGADGILFDLGVSSWHFEQSKKGFSFQKDEPLDMRFSNKTKIAARNIINQWPPEEIGKILKEGGEEKFARQISKAIIEARKRKSILTTFQLVEVIKDAVPEWYRRKKLHFATKTFQALRIAVNDELRSLSLVLKILPQVLRGGARTVMISFHSLEDRIVKQAFKEMQKAGIVQILTKKPITPAISEIIENPRSRSAKMRVIELK